MHLLDRVARGALEPHALRGASCASSRTISGWSCIAPSRVRRYGCRQHETDRVMLDELELELRGEPHAGFDTWIADDLTAIDRRARPRPRRWRRRAPPTSIACSQPAAARSCQRCARGSRRASASRRLESAAEELTSVAWGPGGARPRGLQRRVAPAPCWRLVRRPDTRAGGRRCSRLFLVLVLVLGLGLGLGLVLAGPWPGPWPGPRPGPWPGPWAGAPRGRCRWPRRSAWGRRS